MTLTLNAPADIYQRINEELACIVDSLDVKSNDASLAQAQNVAFNLLTQHQADLQTKLAELEKNSEWKTFTIAFYGETGAGKSTIIETLRILLQEPSKIASQQAFREMQIEFSRSKEDLQRLQYAIDQADVYINELENQLSATLLEHEQLRRTAVNANEQADILLEELAKQLRAALYPHEQLRSSIQNTIDQTDVKINDLEKQLRATLLHHEQMHNAALNDIAQLRVLIAERKKNISFFRRLVFLFRKMPEEIELIRAEQQLPNIAAACESADTSLRAQQSEAKQSKIALEQKLSEITAVRDSASASLRSQQIEAKQSKIALERHLSEITAARDNATASLLRQQAEVEENKRTLTQQLKECESRLTELLAELDKRSDGEIIGDGRLDFTRQTQRYNFELDGQSFALLDVPGIEGREGLIHNEIAQAVQTAHAVFYVTNQAAPPQTGDEQGKGTLEKIKSHLGAQTEVWSIFNKKINNPKHSLIDRPLTSDDENASLDELNKKMHEQLGEHYRDVFPLTALPAFLASTDHFSPNSQNAKRRNKILADFSPDDLLEKSGLRAFLRLLGGKLISDIKVKITQANFRKADEELRQVVGELRSLQSDFAKLLVERRLYGQSAQAQLKTAFHGLMQRIDSSSEILIDSFASNVRKQMYSSIENNISNDYFKDALRDKIDAQQVQLSMEYPAAMSKHIESFQEDVEDTLKRFEDLNRELTETYAKLNNTQFNGKFNLKLNLDNGLKVTNLLAVLAGGALLWWNPAAWYVIAMGAASIAVGAYKAVRGFFSSDYKKSQQRKATDDSLHSVTSHLRDLLRAGLKSALPDMQKKIYLIEQAIAAPTKQTNELVQLLSHSVNQLKALSRQINNVGNL